MCAVGRDDDVPLYTASQSTECPQSGHLTFSESLTLVNRSIPYCLLLYPSLCIHMVKLIGVFNIFFCLHVLILAFLWYPNIRTYMLFFSNLILFPLTFREEHKKSTRKPLQSEANYV